MGKLLLEHRVLGMVQTNVYVLINQESGEALVIDPADEAEKIGALLERAGAKPAGILLTHGHFDHMGAAAQLAEKYAVPICAGSKEAGVLAEPRKNLSVQFAEPLTLRADRLLDNKEHLTMAGFGIEVLHTPGHTEGGVCYYLPEEGILFSGDTLFCESIGRTDFPTGSMSVLVRSARELLRKLPDDTQILPGHGAATTAAHEKEYNPFL